MAALHLIEEGLNIAVEPWQGGLDVPMVPIPPAEREVDDRASCSQNGLANDPRRIPGHHGIGGNRLGDHGAGTDNCAVSNR